MSRVVYLIHLEAPLRSGQQHYLGQTGDLLARVKSHLRHPDVSILATARRRGVAYGLVWVGAGEHAEERKLKKGTLARLCPVCNGHIDFSSLVFFAQSPERRSSVEIAVDFSGEAPTHRGN